MILVTEQILNDLIDGIADAFRRNHPNASELELWQLMKAHRIEGGNLAPHEIAAALRRTKP